MQANINKSNIQQIRQFAAGRPATIQGNKLIALYKLIQAKGETITTSQDHKLNGLKALEFSEGEYIAIKKTSYKTGSFFPAKLETYHMQNL